MAKKSTSASRKASYTNYKASNKRDKNKAIKLMRTLKKNPNNPTAKTALEKLSSECRSYATKFFEKNKNGSYN